MGLLSDHILDSPRTVVPSKRGGRITKWVEILHSVYVTRIMSWGGCGHIFSNCWAHHTENIYFFFLHVTGEVTGWVTLIVGISSGCG